MATPITKTILLEASWEVANKVGGIYTVLATKLPHARSAFGANYFPVGPYVSEKNADFDELAIPESWQPVIDTLADRGVVVHYGTWQLPGKPLAFLLDWTGLIDRNAAIKTTYWEKFKLESLSTDFYDVDQPLLWSTAVGYLASAIAQHSPDTKVLLHAHEWLTSGAILAVKADNAPVKTTFTTHATVLGRAISSQETFIYDKLDSFDADAESRRLNVTTKHQLEALGATQADRFTTVSTITARECTAFLKRTPAVVENGMDPTLFPTYDQLVTRRSLVRRELLNFIASQFFPSYRFDLNQTKIAFTMGRYEYRNKGYDLMLESLGQLNATLKAKHSPETLVALFLVPGDATGVNATARRKFTTYQHLSNILASFSNQEERRIEKEIWDDIDCSCALMAESARDTTRRLLDSVRTEEPPPYSPFDLGKPDQDAITAGAKAHGLLNTADDNVKVLFLPLYLDGFDGLLNLSLYDIVTGCDLGVFPSRYEPWGYTPMESLALGVPAITSTLAGFGEAAPSSPGIFVLDRNHSDGEAEATALATQLSSLITESDRAWVNRRLAAYQSLSSFDWEVLYPKYLAEYTNALAT